MGGMLEQYRLMSKPKAIEGLADLWLIRPCGYLLVKLLSLVPPLTPTMVSGMAVLAGWWTAWLLYESQIEGGRTDLALAAAAAFLLHSALDSADGQLARLTGRQTALGAIVDGVCDNLAFGAIYLAIALSAWSRGAGPAPLLAGLALAAAWSHSIQSSLVDYHRRLYLFCVHGRTDLFDSRPQPHAVRVRGLFPRLLHLLHAPYFRQQRFFLRSTTRLEEQAAAYRRRGPEAAARLARIWDREQRPLLAWWALLASNSHKGGIVLASLVPIGADGWSNLGLVWYFLYDLALNLPMAALIHLQARRDGLVRQLIVDEEVATGPCLSERGMPCR